MFLGLKKFSEYYIIINNTRTLVLVWAVIIMHILSPIENRLYTIYRYHDITYPYDLRIQNLSCVFDILLFIREEPSAAYNIRGIKSIVIDSRLPEYQQKEVFFHELSHLIFHSGSQHRMESSYWAYQEGQADNFALFAAMPYFMIQRYDLSQKNIIEELSAEFLVSYEFVEKRLQRIYNQILVNSS